MKINILYLLLLLYLKVVPCYKGILQLAGNLEGKNHEVR